MPNRQRGGSPTARFTNPETRAYGDSGRPEKALYLVRFENGHLVYADIYEHWLESLR